MTNGLRSLTLTLLACVLISTGACTLDDGPDLAVDEAALHVDPDLTPGSLCTANNPDFDGYRYAEHIAHCQRNVSTSRKKRIYDAYGIPVSARSGYEVDHRISLFAGGDNSNDNLWPLPHDDARRKAALEEQLYLQLNAGKTTQAHVIDVLLSWD